LTSQSADGRFETVKRKRKQFFFEKKEPKNFGTTGLAPLRKRRSRNEVKVFCFFFSKKKCFPRQVELMATRHRLSYSATGAAQTGKRRGNAGVTVDQ
jgi:hypothetical protein